MDYYLCQFEYGYEGQFYQVSENGNVINYVDLTGNEITLTGNYGYYIVINEPTTPSFLI